MTPLLFAFAWGGVLLQPQAEFPATVTLDGEVPAAGGDFAVVDFEVPEGTVEIEITHSDESDFNILDWGVWGPDGFRGWGGGNTEPAIIGAEASSRSYRPGPITPGTWHLVIGKAKIKVDPATYAVTVTVRDAATLTPRPRATPAPVTLETGARWYKGDFHVHSLDSGDASASLEAIVDFARGRGLDFVVISDHNTDSQLGIIAALQPSVSDVLLIPGQEVTTYNGHGNAVNITGYIDHRVGFEGRTITDVIDDVVAQGAVFNINHPGLDLGDGCIGCAWDHPDTPWEEVTGIEINTGSFDVAPLLVPLARELWETHADMGQRWAVVGGSDDHRAGTDMSGLASTIGTPTTLVYADALSAAAITEAMIAGRTMVMLPDPDQPMVDFSISSANSDGMVGDEVAGSEVTVAVHVTGGDGAQVALYRNGAQAMAENLASDDDTISWTLAVSEGGDRFHVELNRGGAPLVVTSHAYATYLPPMMMPPTPTPPEETTGCGCDVAGRGAGGGSGMALCAIVAAAALAAQKWRSEKA